MNDKDQLDLLMKAIDRILEELIYLKKIIVYTSSINDEKVYDIFKKVIDKGIKIIIPDNTLRTRNKILSNKK